MGFLADPGVDRHQRVVQVRNEVHFVEGTPVEVSNGLPEVRPEVEALLRHAEEVDEAEDRQYGKGQRGDELPAELARRESRLKKIREAKEALEAEARQKAQEQKHS